MIVFSPTGSCGLLIFVVYLEKVQGLPGPNCLKCVCMYVGLSCTYWDLLQAKFGKKKKDLLIKK